MPLNNRDNNVTSSVDGGGCCNKTMNTGNTAMERVLQLDGPPLQTILRALNCRQLLAVQPFVIFVVSLMDLKLSFRLRVPFLIMFRW